MICPECGRPDSEGLCATCYAVLGSAPDLGKRAEGEEE